MANGLTANPEQGSMYQQPPEQSNMHNSSFEHNHPNTITETDTNMKTVSEMRFKEAAVLGKYLGVPLTGRAPKKADYRYIIEQVDAKLSAWKAKHLSFAGRVTLAKSVLEAIPIYPMMTAMIPKACIDEIHRIQRKFIWGESGDERRYHAVGWNIVTKPKVLGGLGLRNLDVMNKACIAKLVWNMQTDKKELWCEVLKGKYQRNSEQGMFVAKSMDSSLWKNMIRMWLKVDEACFWSVGNGTKINAWSMAWIDKNVRIVDMEVQVPVALQNAKVVDLIDDDGDWKWELLQWLPNLILQKIAAVPPPRVDAEDDCRVLDLNPAGGMSVTAMYHQLSGFILNDTRVDWKNIWKLQVPERVRSFIWLLRHDRLLTNFKKNRMGLGSAMCEFCGNTVEDTLHVMRDCLLAMPLWLNIVRDCDKVNFFAGNLQQWFNFNMCQASGRQQGVAWRDVWAVACHKLWFWRNKEQHELDFSRPVNPAQQVVKLVHDYQAAVKVQRVVVGLEYERVLVGWTPPSAGWVKLNTDGACREDGRSGCGGVIRGSEGEWLGGFAKNIGRSSVYVAELWGVLEGLSLARRMGFRAVEVNVDSLEVVEILNGRKEGRAVGVSLVKRIRHFLRLDWDVIVSHSYRESNQCADVLAAMGCSLNEVIQFFENCPRQISHVLTADSLGIFIPRLVSV